MAHVRNPRRDLACIILGGDIGAYALARQMHEAFGIHPTLMNTGVIAAIAHSKILEVHLIQSLSSNVIGREVQAFAIAVPNKTVVLLANTDDMVAMLVDLVPSLPSNVVSPIPTRRAFDLTANKISFAQLCEVHGLPTPRTEVIQLAGKTPIATCQLEFPVVVKPARSSEYLALLRQGFKKVYLIHDQDALNHLCDKMRVAGFTGDVLVQKCVLGDDTCMGAITVYMASDGEPRVVGSAQTLLEDHAPSLKGNAVAMLTRSFPELESRVCALLRGVGYQGFAEVDIKQDAKTKEWIFFEVNPRIGRNAYYLVAGGVNPLEAMVNDLVDGHTTDLKRASRPALYTLVPLRLLKRYLTCELASQVDDLVRVGSVFDPQRYSVDAGLRRRIDVALTEWNHLSKFKKYYPQVTDTSF